MLLSILIPTRNRPKALGATLDNLLAQIHDQKEIEVIVADNGSDSRFIEELQYLPKKYGSVHFIFRSENVGIIGNILDLINRSQGRYIWICGDDDALEINILQGLPTHLQKNSPGITKLKPKEVYQAEILGHFEGESSHPFELDMRHFKLKDCLGDFEHKSGFITAHIFRGDLLKNTIIELMRSPTWPTIKDNVYLTKLYTMLACYRDGGFWESRSVLVQQRVSDGEDANFRGSLDQLYLTFFVAPGQCYSALRWQEPEFSDALLSIHFSKYKLWREFRSKGVSPFRMISFAVSLRPKIKLISWLKIFRICFLRQ